MKWFQGVPHGCGNAGQEENMTSAEQFVNDNLERGYSLPDIRSLAGDCDQPLADEIRAVVAARECARRRAERLAVNEQSEASEVACETAMYHAVSAGEEAVFLIGPGEDAEPAADGIDFDLMQGNSASVDAPVLEEESIADIVIGETDGSDIIRAADAGARAMAEEEEAGIWSRLWTRVAGGPVPSVAPSVRMSEISHMENDNNIEQTSHEEAALPSEPMMDAEDPVEFTVDESIDNETAVPDFNPAEASALQSAEASAIEPEAVAQPQPEPEIVSEPVAEMEAEQQPVQNEIPVDTPEAMEEERVVSEAPVENSIAAEATKNEDAVSEAVSVMAEADANIPETESKIEQPIHNMYTPESTTPVEPEAGLVAEPEVQPEAAMEFATPAEERAEAAEAFGGDIEVGSEMSSDYLPGSVVASYDDSEADNFVEEALSDEPVVDEAVTDDAVIEDAVNAAATSEPVCGERAEESQEAVDAVQEAVREESAEIALEALTQSIATEAPEAVLHSTEESMPEAELETAGADETENEVNGEDISEPTGLVFDEPVAEAAEEQAESLTEEPVAAAEEEAEVAEIAPAPEANEADDSKISRRERRRQERAEKKRRRKKAKADKAALPEIVLTRSEGTETLTPVAEAESEAGEFLAAVDESDNFETGAADPATIAEHAYSQDASVPVADAAVTDAADDAVAAAVAAADADADSDAVSEQPRMSRPMSLVTPNDVFEDADSASFVTLFAAAMADMEGPQLSIVKTDDAAGQEEDSLAGDGETAFDNDVADTFSGDDHYMIIANGGVHEDEIAALHLVASDNDEVVEEESAADSAAPVLHTIDTAEGGDDSEDAVESAEGEDAFDGGANVILFRENFPFLAQNNDDDDADNDGAAMLEGGPVLHLLPPVEEAARDDSAVAEAGAEAEAGVKAIAMAEQPLLENTLSPVEEPSFPAALVLAAPAGDHLTAESRAGILMAMYGPGTVDDLVEPADSIPYTDGAASAEEDHAIVSMEPFPDYPLLLEKEQELRRDLEDEYQVRLDAFAARLLDVQTAGAQTEEKLQNAKAELDARAAVLEEMKNRLAKEEEAKADLARRLECTTSEMNSRERELDRVRGLRDEHQRLFNEFEDLRKAYNEVVTGVMPTLQNERDDLALTVERQCAEERQVRSQLGATRRRLTVGYGLGVAASLVLIALPVANWLKSSERARETAESEQLLSELRDNLHNEVEQNIRAQNEIVELQNKIGLARAQIVDLQSKNQELAQVRTRVMQPDSDIAVFRPESATGGTPTRASTMALQATPPASGRLHVNEVRDPAGSIEQVVAMNRARNQDGDQVAVRPAGNGQAGGRMQVSAVARTDARSLRPGGDVARINAQSNAGQPGRTSQAKPQATAKPGEMLATVKKGEGVAQVVYRVLGTWNPEVVAWVIRENKIKSDRRGNPIIQPNQQLRLPNEGNIGQAASAKRR